MMGSGVRIPLAAPAFSPIFLKVRVTTGSPSLCPASFFLKSRCRFCVRHWPEAPRINRPFLVGDGVGNLDPFEEHAPTRGYPQRLTYLILCSSPRMVPSGPCRASGWQTGHLLVSIIKGASLSASRGRPNYYKVRR